MIILINTLINKNPQTYRDIRKDKGDIGRFRYHLYLIFISKTGDKNFTFFYYANPYFKSTNSGNHVLSGFMAPTTLCG